jgi:hypothetical protein
MCEHTYFVGAKLDGRFGHDLDDVQSVTCRESGGTTTMRPTQLTRVQTAHTASLPELFHSSGQWTPRVHGRSDDMSRLGSVYRLLGDVGLGDEIYFEAIERCGRGTRDCK